MSEYIHLIGAEDVRSAGHQIASTASDINRAASNFESVFESHQRFIDDSLQRFQIILEDHNQDKNKEMCDSE